MLEMIQVGRCRAMIRVEHLLPLFHDRILLASGNDHDFHLDVSPWVATSLVADRLREMLTEEAKSFAEHLVREVSVGPPSTNLVLRGLILDEYWGRLFRALAVPDLAEAPFLSHCAMLSHPTLDLALGESGLVHLVRYLRRAKRLRRLPWRRLWSLLRNIELTRSAAENVSMLELEIRHCEALAGNQTESDSARLAQYRRLLVWMKRYSMAEYDPLAVVASSH